MALATVRVIPDETVGGSGYRTGFKTQGRNDLAVQRPRDFWGSRGLLLSHDYTNKSTGRYNTRSGNCLARHPSITCNHSIHVSPFGSGGSC